MTLPQQPAGTTPGRYNDLCDEIDYLQARIDCDDTLGNDEEIDTLWNLLRAAQAIIEYYVSPELWG